LAPALHSAAELRCDFLAFFLGQRFGEVAAPPPGIRIPIRAFRCQVYVHEPAVHVVQARGNHQAVD
jgi:hypothetical protein